jgi:hypothetical protein
VAGKCWPAFMFVLAAAARREHIMRRVLTISDLVIRDEDAASWHWRPRARAATKAGQEELFEDTKNGTWYTAASGTILRELMQLTTDTSAANQRRELERGGVVGTPRKVGRTRKQQS